MYIQLYTHIYINRYIQTCMLKHKHLYKHIHTCIQTYICMHTYIYI